MATRKRATAKKAPGAPDDKSAETEKTDDKVAQGFPVVGIGASAGGLAALEAFFSGMPVESDPGIALVIVQHLAPDHKSILTELIQRCTRMQVFEVQDGMVVQPNCAYIIPPNRDMAFLNGALHLIEPSAPRGLRLPIDFFFRTLADDQRERAICIVLSGTGSDGTLGMRAIKGEGGIVIVQSPETAEYDGMPSSAIATGLVDFVLPPAKMPPQIIAYVARTQGTNKRALSIPTPTTENALKKIFIVLRSQTGHDFSQYKPSTIQRRIERRMAIHQIETIDEYGKYLQQTPVEVNVLFRDLLIGVTSFFRDAEAFAALESKVIPRIFAGKSAGAAIRVWTPGCSTGEEAYSIAILLREHMEALKKSFNVQVFATDIDSRAISVARAGIYPASVALDISPDRLAHFFVQEPDNPDGSPGGYRVHTGIRDLLVFSEQNAIKDPPFSRLDLISCRNLLIYMGAELHKKLISLFHYALNPGGFLFQGTSETVGNFVDLFRAVDRKWKLYERLSDSESAPGTVPSGVLTSMTAYGGFASKAEETKKGVHGKLPLRELTEQALLHQVAPATVLVNRQGSILYLHGRTGMYLELAPGEAGINNILKMARKGLRRDLTTALHKAAATKGIVRYPGLRVKTNGDFTTVNLTVHPVAPTPTVDLSSTSNLFLVIFEEAPADSLERSEKTGAVDSIDDMSAQIVDARVAALTQEIRDKEEYLQASNEELETSNEELKSFNEEMQSVNEELQSTNEELQTSKEELQSVNEELATVNTECQTKMADLSRANNDMNNLLAGTGIGTIFVDHQLLILRFTPSVTQFINLIPSDVGRPVGDIVSNLIGYDRLTADVKTVLDKLVIREEEVQGKSGKWFTMRIQPYRTLANVIEGAVITFVDITRMKNAQAVVPGHERLRRLAVVVRDASDAITTQDLEGRILAWNPAAVRLYGWSEAEALMMNVSERIPEKYKNDELTVIRRLAESQVLEPYSAERIAKDGTLVKIRMTASALLNEAGQMHAIMTTERAQAPNFDRAMEVHNEKQG